FSLFSHLHHVLFFLQCLCYTRYLHSFPTRRSSDLILLLAYFIRFFLRRRTGDGNRMALLLLIIPLAFHGTNAQAQTQPPAAGSPDRKSTRLNSSHEWISYAVFCLKKKTTKTSKIHS